MPFEVIKRLTDAAHGYTAYTSLWRSCDQRFREIAMASVSSPKHRAEARDLGWRTYRIRAADTPVLSDERICPASSEGQHRLTCAECLACDGMAERAKRDVVIIAHGSTFKRRRLRVLLGEQLVV